MNFALLLDENISPFLTRNLAEMGVFAQGVVHIGLSGQPDRVVWAHALQHDMTMVTTNADDFLELADEAELHSGLILLRESGLSREQQWIRLEPVIRFVRSQSDPDYLLNRLIDVLGPGRFLSETLPRSSN